MKSKPTAIPFSSIKSKFIHKGIEKDELSIINMVLKHNISIGIFTNNNGNQLNYTTAEDAERFLRLMGIEQKRIDDFFESIKSTTAPHYSQEIIFQNFNRKEELIQFLSKRNSDGMTKEESKAIKKELKAKIAKEKIENFILTRSEKLNNRINKIIELLQENYCFLDFEFNTKNKKITQAGIILSEEQGGQSIDFIFSKTPLRYNPKNYLELGLSPKTINSKRSKEMINILKQQKVIIFFGGTEDKKFLRCMGIRDVKFIDVQSLVKYCENYPDINELPSLEKALSYLSPNTGKFLTGRELLHFERYQQDFIENDSGVFKSRNKPYFFNQIGLHNGYNDALLTLALLRAILNKNGQHQLDALTDNVMKKAENELRKKIKLTNQRRLKK